MLVCLISVINYSKRIVVLNPKDGDKNGCLSTPIAADAGGVVLGGNYILG